MLELGHIEDALRKGARLNAFISGTGLRVVKVTGNDIKGYGEGECIEEALLYCNHNLNCPDEKLTPSDLGFELPTSLLDKRMGRGQKFYAWYDGMNICIQWRSLEEFKLPPAIRLQVIDMQEALPYRDPIRKFIYVVKPTTMPGNGMKTVEITTAHVPEGQTEDHAFHYHVIQETSGTDGIYPLLLRVLDAPKVEQFKQE